MVNKQSNSMRTIRSPSPSPSPPPPPSSIPSESFQIPMHENPNIDDDDIFYRLIIIIETTTAVVIEILMIKVGNHQI